MTAKHSCAGSDTSYHEWYLYNPLLELLSRAFSQVKQVYSVLQRLTVPHICAEIRNAARRPARDRNACVPALLEAGAHAHRGVHCLPESQGVRCLARGPMTPQI